MKTTITTEDYQRLIPHLALVSISLYQVIYEPGEPITHVYFPHQAIVSLVSTMEEGSTVEVGLVGNDGMVGTPVFLGVTQRPTERSCSSQAVA